MLAVPCVLPVPNPPTTASNEWQADATFWQTEWNRVYNLKRGRAKAVVRFRSFYCRSDYAHLIAVAVGGK